MPGNTRRRKSKHQKGGFLSVLLVFFLVFQSVITSFTEAYADDEPTDIFSESEESDEALYDIPDEDSGDLIEQVPDGEPAEEEAEEEKEASEETVDDDLDTGQETEEENEITDQLEEIDVGDNDPENNEPDKNCELPENDSTDDDDVSGLAGKADSGEEEKADEPAVYDAKAPPEQLEEEIQEKKAEADAENEKSRRMLPEEEEDTDSDGPVRSSAASPEEMPRNIYRFHLSAVDLAVTAVQHAEYAIQEKGGNTLYTMTLSDDNGWQADWEYIARKELTLTVEEVALYDSDGNNVKDRWEGEPKLKENAPSYETTNAWAEAGSLEIGTYVIEIGSGEEKRLLAVDNPNDMLTVGGSKYWELSLESSTVDNASDAATWNVVNATKYGSRVKNAALPDKNAYLTEKTIAKKEMFALYQDDALQRIVFENHRLKTADNYYLLVSSGKMTGVTSVDEASELTIYRLVTYNDTVYESSVRFIHEEKPPPVLDISVTIKLLVGGNVGERDRDFLFYASVNGGEAKTFSLSHQGEYVLNEIPIGSALTINMEAPNYHIKAVYNDGDKMENGLTVSGVPPDGGTVIFYAKCNAKLETGIQNHSRCYVCVLMAVFLGVVLQPFIKTRVKTKTKTKEKN